jgi:hypothetical protein
MKGVSVDVQHVFFRNNVGIRPVLVSSPRAAKAKGCKVGAQSALRLRTQDLCNGSPETSLEVQLNTSAMPEFPLWVRSAVRQEAAELWAKLPAEKDPSQAQKVLEELIANPLMKRVWDEMYRSKRENPKEFFNPARLSNTSQAAAYRDAAIKLRKKGGDKNNQDAKFLELEASMIESSPGEQMDFDSEQDSAARLFLARAYRIALYHEPTVLADIQAKTKQLRNVAERLQNLAQQLRSVAQELSSMGKSLFPYYAGRLETDAYAAILEHVAADCLDDAKILEPRRSYTKRVKQKKEKPSDFDSTKDIAVLAPDDPKEKLVYEPWIIVRKRGDIRRRTIVGKLAHVTHSLFMKPLYGTIANVTNVICAIEPTNLITDGEGKSLTNEDVEEILGDYAREIRPSFGPLIYPRGSV